MNYMFYLLIVFVSYILSFIYAISSIKKTKHFKKIQIDINYISIPKNYFFVIDRNYTFENDYYKKITPYLELTMDGGLMLKNEYRKDKIIKQYKPNPQLFITLGECLREDREKLVKPIKHLVPRYLEINPLRKSLISNWNFQLIAIKSNKKLYYPAAKIIKFIHITTPNDLILLLNEIEDLCKKTFHTTIHDKSYFYGRSGLIVYILKDIASFIDFYTGNENLFEISSFYTKDNIINKSKIHFYYSQYDINDDTKILENKSILDPLIIENTNTEKIYNYVKKHGYKITKIDDTIEPRKHYLVRIAKIENEISISKKQTKGIDLVKLDKIDIPKNYYFIVNVIYPRVNTLNKIVLNINESSLISDLKQLNINLKNLEKSGKILYNFGYTDEEIKEEEYEDEYEEDDEDEEDEDKEDEKENMINIENIPELDTNNTDLPNYLTLNNDENKYQFNHLKYKFILFKPIDDVSKYIPLSQIIKIEKIERIKPNDMILILNKMENYCNKFGYTTLFKNCILNFMDIEEICDWFSKKYSLLKINIKKISEIQDDIRVYFLDIDNDKKVKVSPIFIKNEKEIKEYLDKINYQTNKLDNFDKSRKNILTRFIKKD